MLFRSFQPGIYSNPLSNQSGRLNPTIAPVLKQTISPAVSWERINNVETPQLYPVFPWRIYGVGKEDLDMARNTYFYDPDAIKFRSHTGWK